MTTQASHLATHLVSKTHPISLRTIQPRDAARLSQLLSVPESGSDPNAKPMDVSTAETAIARQRESAAQPTICGPDGSVISGPTRVNMALVLQEGADAEPVMVGLGGFGAIKDREVDGRKVRVGDVGALLDPAHRGKGYATEALRLAIDWAFTPVSRGGPQLDLVTITTLSDNVAMVRLAEEKLGLKGKGVSTPLKGEGHGKVEMQWVLRPDDWKM